MRFQLDDVLVDDILFHMENQDGEFLLDTQEGKVIEQINDIVDDEDAGRYISLPEWSSNDGYRLMEKFALDLKNPVVRQELSDALNRNRGVFRAYRNVLAQYPEIEKKWYAFKDCEMRNEVISWYNALREEWGLEPVGVEPDDNLPLIMEDFLIREGTQDFSFVAETTNGESAGSVNAQLKQQYEKTSLYVNCLEVTPAFRGMGLGKALLAKILEKADKAKLNVIIDLPCESDFFSRSLHLEDFKPVMRRFLRKSEN